MGNIKLLHPGKWLILAIVIGVWSCNMISEKNESSVFQPADIELSEITGQKLDLDNFKGKTIFINFWATWCGPCIQEMPSIAKAMEELKNRDIVFLFASNESTGQISKFRDVHDYPFHYVKVGNLEELNVMAIPTTFIFDPEGKLVFSEMGYRKWNDQKNIDFLLNISKPS